MHGIPWSYESDQLSAMFTDFDPNFGIESAEVVYGKDNRSRVCSNASAASTASRSVQCVRASCGAGMSTLCLSEADWTFALS